MMGLNGVPSTTGIANIGANQCALNKCVHYCFAGTFLNAARVFPQKQLCSVAAIGGLPPFLSFLSKARVSSEFISNPLSQIGILLFLVVLLPFGSTINDLLTVTEIVFMVAFALLFFVHIVSISQYQFYFRKKGTE